MVVSLPGERAGKHEPSGKGLLSPTNVSLPPFQCHHALPSGRDLEILPLPLLQDGKGLRSHKTLKVSGSYLSGISPDTREARRALLSRASSAQ